MKRIVLVAVVACSLISANAAVYQYDLTFGPEALGATGSGTGTVFYNDVSQSLQMIADFSGLSGNVSVSHFHGPTVTPGTGTFGIAVGNSGSPASLPNFPAGGTSGSYNQTLDLTQTTAYNGGFLSGPGGGTAAGAEVAFFNAMNEGRVYWNIHSTAFPGGEIRGFLTIVPEPSSLTMLGLGVAALVIRGRKLAGK